MVSIVSSIAIYTSFSVILRPGYSLISSSSKLLILQTSQYLQSTGFAFAPISTSLSYIRSLPSAVTTSSSCRLRMKILGLRHQELRAKFHDFIDLVEEILTNRQKKLGDRMTLCQQYQHDPSECSVEWKKAARAKSAFDVTEENRFKTLNFLNVLNLV